jgi:2-haloacid dehalogenase
MDGQDPGQDQPKLLGAKVPQDAEIELPWQPSQGPLIACRVDPGKRLSRSRITIQKGAEPMASPTSARQVVVFDLGGVLIDWNPRYLYRKLFADEPAMERFLAEVCHAAWNEEQDRGRSFAAAVEEAAARHPDQRALIEAYHLRWGEMLAGPIPGSVQILEELKQAGHELHALTNWSVETFPIARERYEFLDHFESILVSGEVGLIKPDPRIFELLLARIGHAPAVCIYIDDNAANAAAAGALGFDAIHFRSPAQLRAELARREPLRGLAERG